MKLTDDEKRFLEVLAQSDVGSGLVKYLEHAEQHYADIRNLEGIDAKIRIDALKMLRSILLDKLLVLSGKIEPPDLDEYR